MGVKINITDLTFSENAFFFHVVDGETVLKRDVEKALYEASEGKVGNYPIKFVRRVFNGVPDVKCSMRLFKSVGKPSFFVNSKKGWDEQKIGYILIVEYNSYVIIMKRNSSSVKHLYTKLEPLSYPQLLSMYVNNDTEFEKLSMYNMDGSSSALRGKTYEANDLRENFSTVGASRFILRTFRAKNTRGRVAMSLSSSRINEFQSGKSIDEICSWAKQTIDRFISHPAADTFLSIFAKPLSYTKEWKNLQPDSLLVFIHSLLRNLGNQRYTFEKVIGRNYVSVSDQLISRYLSRFVSSMDVQQNVDANGIVHYYAYRNGNNTGVEVVMTDRNIHLENKIWKSIRVTDNVSQNKMSLQALINTHNEYNVYFTGVQRMYSNRHLYEDAQLLSNIDQFLLVLKPVARLNFTNSEKGNIKAVVDRFEPHSVFGVVEHYAMSQYSFFICDDMGVEWADHIGISKDRVAFFVSKSKDSNCSASDFQDVVGQALKNAGYLAATSTQLNSKKNKWRGTWNNRPLQRLRKGAGTVDDAVALWSNAVNHPYFHREMNLVVDFLSYKDMKVYLNNLKNGIAFQRKNEAFQLLWLLSSLISNCKLLDVDVHVYCKP